MSDTQKQYMVNIHLGGKVTYVVEAFNSDEAEDKAVFLFREDHDSDVDIEEVESWED